MNIEVTHIYIEKGDRVTCTLPPGYGKWRVNGTYKVDKVSIEDQEIVIRDEKNERKNFSLDKDSNYFAGNYFKVY